MFSALCKSFEGKKKNKVKKLQMTGAVGAGAEQHMASLGSLWVTKRRGVIPGHASVLLFDTEFVSRLCLRISFIA